MKSKIPILKYRDQKPINTNILSIGNASAKDTKEYTGTDMLGIATMHKSNAVPVFSKEEAEDISNMR